MSTACVAVITFPGSNGDHDALHALREDVGVDAFLHDYRETSLDGVDAAVLPGGFSYGDALRCGAIARFAPIMRPLREFAEQGKPVLGICNGFQILAEAHLLPGVLLPNRTLRFHCFQTRVRVEATTSPWLSACKTDDLLTLPVAHGEGAYFIDGDGLSRLEAGDQIALRYVGPSGSKDDDSANLNGSVAAIAGITNARGNVLGLMPHPERATNALVGGEDGLRILSSLQNITTRIAKAS